MPHIHRSSVLMTTAVAAFTLLSGCGSSFRTDYSVAAPAEARSAWSPRVQVVVPASLSVSDANVFVPRADIVWHGEPPGDRRAQASAIVKEGLSLGFAGLNGHRAVVATATVKRFHAVSPKAYFLAPAGAGVHTIEFILTVTDANTGVVLAGPEKFHADLPATMASHGNADETRLPGDVWRKEIEDHLATTIKGWLGTGPDVRGRFVRIGI